ncbi:MAG: Hsp20 family protein [Alphaproteobacteria bacterium]|nr:Hsp20 family protein [Alphaproteobacteria bacterium]
MDRLSFFSSPLFLGFDHFERLVDTLSKIDDSYPPYNIEQIGDHGFRITLALAGFRKESISIVMDNNQLIIKGKQEADPNAVYLHRGIASRQFMKSFVLSDTIEVINAEFENGLLHINLQKVRNENDVKKIEISEPVHTTVLTMEKK